MRRAGAIAGALTGWWRAWIAALGGANQLTMREAYRDAHEHGERGVSRRRDASGPADPAAVEKRVR